MTDRERENMRQMLRTLSDHYPETSQIVGEVNNGILSVDVANMILGWKDSAYYIDDEGVLHTCTRR